MRRCAKCGPDGRGKVGPVVLSVPGGYCIVRSYFILLVLLALLVKNLTTDLSVRTLRRPSQRKEQATSESAP